MYYGQFENRELKQLYTYHVTTRMKGYVTYVKYICGHDKFYFLRFTMNAGNLSRVVVKQFQNVSKYCLEIRHLTDKLNFFQLHFLKKGHEKQIRKKIFGRQKPFSNRETKI